MHSGAASFERRPFFHAAGSFFGKSDAPFLTRHPEGSRVVNLSKLISLTAPGAPSDVHSSCALFGMNGERYTACRASRLTKLARVVSNSARLAGSLASFHGAWRS